MRLKDLVKKVTIPEGKSEGWSISKYTVPEPTRLDIARAAIKENGRIVPAGTYTALRFNGSIVMSDTPDEMRDHYEFIRNAHDHVLINGLGLGLCINACLRKPQVTKVTVIENSKNVINLVAKHISNPILEIIHHDALTYKPPKGIRYGAVWHDIWPAISSDNLADMHTLHRRYGRRCKWQGSWCRMLCERQRKEDKIYEMQMETLRLFRSGSVSR